MREREKEGKTEKATSHLVFYIRSIVSDAEKVAGNFPLIIIYENRKKIKYNYKKARGLIAK